MAGYALPENIDSTYPNTSDPTVQLHQDYHDKIHDIVNKFDKDAAPSDGQVLTWDSTAGLYLPETAAAGLPTIQDEGTPRTVRPNINFTGSGVSTADNAGANRTDITISSAGYITVQDEGVAENARAIVNFVGAGVDVTDDSTNGRTTVTITGSATTVPRPVSLLVASTDAPALVKAGADYVCDGTADQTEINAALVRAAPLSSRSGPALGEQRGVVELSGGRFQCSGSILMQNATWLRGQGALTEIRPVSLTAVTGSGTLVGLIKKSSLNDHLIRVSDLYLDGNGASGGANCHGVYFDGVDGTASYSGYPDTNPDSDHWIHNLYIKEFWTGARTGVLLRTGTSPASERGSIIADLQIRRCSQDGISLETASDVRVASCHIGTITRYGVNASGGNTELLGMKAFYCDSAAFYFSSGRCIATGCASQDSNIGFYFDGSPSVGTSLVADTSDVAGIQVSTDRLVLSGFSIFHRTGARYATQQRGLWMDATYADLMILGQIDDPGITSRIVGTAGARSFMRVSDGTSLVSVG